MTKLLQRIKKQEYAFQLPCYKVFKKYLKILGQYPCQTGRSRKINVTVVMCCLLTILIPSILQLFEGMQKKDLAMTLESMPYIATVLVSKIKLLNHDINRKKFENLYDRMMKQWEISEHNGELHVLKKVADQGSKMATLYRISLWSFAVGYVSTPLSAPILDLITRSNETRKRVPLFKLNYTANTEENFYLLYLQSVCCSLTIVAIVITIDSFYMVIFHYISGVFALCGHQIKKATEIEEPYTNVSFANETRYDLLRRCVNTHHEAIRFYEYMDDCTRVSYLLQVGLSMFGITSTAVLVVISLDRPDEAFNTVVFLLGQQFHLFVISLPGQVLLDRSFELRNDIYYSKWYQVPLKFQKVMHIMLIRSSKAYKLTAGGLYEMNIENFGKICKTCASYFTILLSLRE